jgi:hypothetical protein
MIRRRRPNRRFWALAVALQRLVPAIGGEGDTGPMGFNPFRPRRTRPTDVVFVAAGLLLTLALLLWAAGVV